MPFEEDIDPSSVYVHAPTSTILICGGEISDISERVPLSLRDAFFKILDFPVLRGQNLILAEDITREFAFFERYKNLLDFETDIAQIVELIILFCESEGSLAELGAFAMIDEISARLFVIVRKKHWDDNSFVRLGPLKRIEQINGRESIFVIDDQDVDFHHRGFSETSKEKLESILTSPLTQKLEVRKEPSTFDTRRQGHKIKLIVGLIQEYGALKSSEIKALLQLFSVDCSEQELTGYLHCAVKVEWIKQISRGISEYYVALSLKTDAAVIKMKSNAKQKDKARRRHEIREHWHKTDGARFQSIIDVAGGARE